MDVGKLLAEGICVLALRESSVQVTHTGRHEDWPKRARRRVAI